MEVDELKAELDKAREQTRAAHSSVELTAARHNAELESAREQNRAAYTSAEVAAARRRAEREAAQYDNNPNEDLLPELHFELATGLDEEEEDSGDDATMKTR